MSDYIYKVGDKVEFTKLFKEIYREEMDGEDFNIVKRNLDELFIIEELKSGYEEDINWYVIVIEERRLWFKEEELVCYEGFELEEELFLI